MPESSNAHEPIISVSVSIEKWKTPGGPPERWALKTRQAVRLGLPSRVVVVDIDLALDLDGESER